MPWVANTTGAINQVTDLYVTNPATTPMNLELTFRTLSGHGANANVHSVVVIGIEPGWTVTCGKCG